MQAAFRENCEQPLIELARESRRAWLHYKTEKHTLSFWKKLFAVKESPKTGASSIHDATQDDDLAKVRALLKKNPELALSKDNAGWTPLHVAALRDNKDMAEVLLGGQADVNAKNGGGETPLHIAVKIDGEAVTELLLANKAEVNAKDDSGRTPLHLAVTARIADLLRQHGGHAEAQSQTFIKVNLFQMNAQFLKDQARVQAMFKFVRPTVGDIRLIDFEFENGVSLLNVRIENESLVTIPSKYAAMPVKTIGVPDAERQRAFMPMIEKEKAK